MEEIISMNNDIEHTQWNCHLAMIFFIYKQFWRIFLLEKLIELNCNFHLCYLFGITASEFNYFFCTAEQWSNETWMQADPPMSIVTCTVCVTVFIAQYWKLNLNDKLLVSHHPVSPPISFHCVFFSPQRYTLWPLKNSCLFWNGLLEIIKVFILLERWGCSIHWCIIEKPFKNVLQHFL